MQYIYSDDWKELEKRFPSAVAFLRERALENELDILRRGKDKPWFNEWQQRRLEELERWEACHI